MKDFKKKLLAGKPMHGCWLNLGSNVSAEIVGKAGFDWLLIDLEHGVGDLVVLYQQLQALSTSTSFPIVRMDDRARPKAQQVLDFGGMGIMFPQIRTVDEAKEASSLLYYTPRGTRGVAKMVRAMNFGSTFDDYHATMGEQLVCVIQVETMESLNHLNEIAAIPDVDVLFVGPSDLTMGMGIFGQFRHKKYLDAVDKVANAATKSSKACGVLLWSLDDYELYFSKGYRFFAMGGDAAFVAAGAKAVVNDLGNLAGKMGGQWT